MKPVYLLAPIALTLFGCGGSDDEPHNSGHDNTGTPYAYEVIECGRSWHTTIDEPSREVITDVHRFREVYGVSDLNNQDDIPTIDFDTQQVVAMHAGRKPNPGHSLRIDQVVEVEDRIEVRYTNILPNSSGDCAYPSVIAHPYCFISMAKSDLSVTYSGITEEGSCGGEE
ncbi:protease complex subunit PrcB family protein [Gilvimarinus sp. DA14]|uniref:protease complex subunit PrcB family protein n=1 Tax=Gilvimarinus sp. DA14 TaxID=2956798 RepID=UPI0020B70798|nr:protease complex subunit PrcB family protein [Gilvimarinus sp. DA14]UTF59028.1 protease complex subunit PrcB family protein [Gilvimarinus sp. DA14]